MGAATLTTVPGFERLDALHAGDLPQKDNLCGAFWASLVLRAAGFEEVDGEPVDQDLVAVHAGALLPAEEEAEPVPPGESPRTDYRLSIPTTEDPSLSGTSAAALARALGALSGGALRAIPVAGPWERGRVLGLYKSAAAATSSVAMIANVQTGLLWASRPSPGALLACVAGRPVDPPPPDWDVGHFVTLAGAVHGTGGSLVIVRDTYASLGWQGYHLQPEEAVAAALARMDGREGGVLCVVPSADADRLRERLQTARYELHDWDNGTPDPGDADVRASASRRGT